jgi:methyl-accepting chemotaxis protein
MLLNRKKEVLYSEGFNTSSKEYIDISNSTKSFFKDKNLDSFVSQNRKLKFLTLDYEKLMFSLQKVDEIGYIFVAKSINSDFLNQLSSILDGYVSLFPSYTLNNPKSKSGFKYEIDRSEKTNLFTAVEVSNTLEDSSFYLLIKNDRTIFNELIENNKLILQLFFISFIVFNLLVYIFINKIFTRRIDMISKTVKSVSKNKDLVKNIELVYDDEITYLSKKMNEMFKVIHESQAETLKKERDFLQSVLDSQKNIIFITDGNQIQGANKKFTDVFKDGRKFLNNIAILDDNTQSNLLSQANTYNNQLLCFCYNNLLIHQ